LELPVGEVNLLKEIQARLKNIYPTEKFGYLIDRKNVIRFAEGKQRIMFRPAARNICNRI